MRLRKLLALSLLLLGTLLHSLVQAAEVSVPFKSGFMGSVGSNTQQANTIKTFTTLGISSAEFRQTSSNGQFSTQGNDISGFIRLRFTTGTILDVPGAVVWQDKPSGSLDVVGFIPSNSTPISFNYGGSQSYQIVGGGARNATNIGLKTNFSTYVYTDGDSPSGNAAGVLTELNNYLTTSATNAPAGPVSVNSQTTVSTSPTVQGAVTLLTGETLTVVVNRVNYSGTSVTNCSGQTLTAPYSGPWCISTSSLSIGSYDVVATITNSAGYTLQDKTVNELVIGNASTTYHVTYNGNTSNSGSAPSDGNSYAFGSSVTVLGNTGTLAKTGFSFGGWNTQANGSGAMYSPGNTFSIGADTTLYAYWTTTLYTVSFDSNSGSVVTSQSVAYGGTAVEPVAPTRSSYSFAGWYSDSGLTTSFSFSTPITANKTLYAKWTAAAASYTVTFDSQGGSSIASQTVNSNSTATEPASPTKTGYTFGGWYSNINLTTTFSFSTPITGATTLYAKWTANAPSATTSSASSVTSTSVTLNGSVNPNGLATTVSFSYGLNNSYGTTVSASTGASISAGNGSTAVSLGLTGLSCGTTYHFRVEATSLGGTSSGSDATFTTTACPTYSVTYNGNSNTAGTVPVDGTAYSSGATVTVASNSGSLTQTGYTFAGWNATAAGTGTNYAASSTFSISSNTTLYAKWTANAPSATTGSASSLDKTVATLNGTVNPNGLSTTVTFQWGTTNAYGNSVTASQSPLSTSAGSTSVSASLGSLTCNTTYHYRVVTSSSGGTTNGLDGMFTTSPCPGTLSGEVSRKKQNGGGYEKVSGISVSLINSSNTTVATTTTDSIGRYSFTNITAGTYSVTFSTPAGAKGVKAGSANSATSSSSITGLVVSDGAALTGADAVVVDPAGVIYDAITRAPLAGAAVWLYKNNVLVPDSQLDTNLGTINGAVTGSDGVYSLVLNATAITGTYELRVTPPAGYIFQSTQIPASGTTYIPQLGGHTEAIQTQSTAPTGGQSTVYYLTFDFTITSSLATTSNGVINNHIPLDLQQYSVSFNSNGGSGVASQTINYGSLATQPSSSPTKVGNTFAGWYSDSGLTTAFNFSTVITGTTTLYAKWTGNAPSAITGGASSATTSGATLAGTVNDNGLSTSVSFEYGLSNTYGMSVNATTGGTLSAGTGSSAVAVPLNGLSCGTVYHYRVIATSAGGTTYGNDATFTTSNCPAGTVALSFQSSGGSVVPSQNVSSGSAPSRPADPIRTGYSFTGWFSDSGLTQAFNFSTPMSTNATAWAGWQINTYSINISVSPAGSGTVTCTPNPVSYGNSVACTAAPAAGYTLVSFGGVCSGSSCNLTNVTAIISVSATFSNNVAPLVSALRINGDPQNGLVLTGSYVYSDADNDREGVSLFRWLLSNDAQGNSVQAISGATALTFTPDSSHEGKYIIFCATPKALTGVITGAEACSAVLGPVAPEDIDGVTPSIEGSVPARGNRARGDGNGDGIPDRLQNHVASLPTTVGNAYATVVSESSKQLNSVSAQPTPNSLPTLVRAPYGALQFMAEGVAASALENFSIYLPYDRRIAGAMKLNRFTQQWDLIGTVSQVGTDVTVIRFTLENGGPYDADGDANNSQIRDPIVPVYLTYTVSATVSGLSAGEALVLSNNGNDSLTFNSNGSLAFATALLEADPYNVTLLSQPSGSNCTVTNGAGTMPAANVTQVSISCVSNATPPSNPGPSFQSIPTLGEWAMFWLTGLLMLSAGLFLNPRFKAAWLRACGVYPL